MTLLAWIILALIVLAILIILAAWFYVRETNEVALLRTGIGGRKVVIDGGVLAIPFFHEISRVNMQTIRIEVSRTGGSALITKDRMRIDVGAEFYISVTPNENSVVRAAQTLGRRTFQPEQLKQLFDGMMVDALRAVAAQLTMDELHENRAEFVRQVREVLADVLAKYGLLLDSVSLTALDQTPFSALDENNAFNAVGMRKLAEVIAKSKKERAEIEGESQVSVRRAEMDAHRRKLEIDLEQKRAEIAQNQEVEMLLAKQLTEVAQRKAQAESDVAHARIQMERDIQSASIAREQAIREAEIIQLRELSAKSEESSKAEAQATTARSAVIKAEVDLQSLQQIAEAERRKKLALLAAEQEAEANATRSRIAAEAEKDIAKARTVAAKEDAEALKVSRLAQADATKAAITAENSRSADVVKFELEKARLAALPGIIAEMVKPAEKINSISINHVTGLGKASGQSAEHASPVNQTIDSILDLAVTLPVMKKIGDAIGMNLEGIVPAKSKETSKGS
jgi:flotillin